MCTIYANIYSDAVSRLFSFWFSALPTITRGAVLTAALIGLIRLIFRNVLSAKAKYYLWLLLVLRLMLPVVPASPLSLLNYIPEPGTLTQAQTAPEAPAAPDSLKNPIQLNPDEAAQLQPVKTETAAVPEIVEAVPEAPSVPSAPAAPKIPRTEILFWVWLSGAGLLFLIYGALYTVTAIRLKRLPVCTDSDTLRVFLNLKRALGVKGRVRLVSGGAGMLGGVFHSTIVLPVEQHGEDVSPILVHELLHYKYWDLRLFVLFRLLAVIYWFNPVVWLLLHFAKLDCEAACDQRVLETNLVAADRYAGALYAEGSLHMKKGVLLHTTFGGSRHSLKRRIRRIAEFKRPGVWVTALAAALAIIVTACTITGAAPKTEIQAAIVGAEEAKSLLHCGYYPSGQLTTENLKEDKITAQISAMDQLLRQYYSEDSWIIANARINDYARNLQETWTQPENLYYLADGGVLSCKLSRLQVSGDTAAVKAELVTYSNTIEMDEAGKFVLRCGGTLLEDLTYHLVKKDAVWKVQSLDNPGGDAWRHPWSVELPQDTFDTFEEALTAAKAIDGRSQCPYKNLDTDLPHISQLPNILEDGAEPEDSSALDGAADSFTFSPFVQSETGLSYGNTHWGMTVEEVLGAEVLQAEDFPLQNRGRNYSMEGPISGHPEVESVEFEFHFTDLNLSLGLDFVQVNYNPDAISYSELLTLRTGQLGPPTATEENAAHWGTDSIGLTLTLTKNGFLREMCNARGQTSPNAADTLSGLNIEEYLSTIQPPNGHYGWTYEQHVEAGLLPNDSLLESISENGQEFICSAEIELGGETVEAQYIFVPTYATLDTDGRAVLTQVMVTPPEGIAVSKWVSSFSDSFTDKLFESQNLIYKSPLTVGALLPETQQQEIMDAIRAHNNGESVTLGSWSLVQNWFQQDARVWHFNGTGAALYLTAVQPYFLSSEPYTKYGCSDVSMKLFVEEDNPDGLHTPSSVFTKNQHIAFQISAAYDATPEPKTAQTLYVIRDSAGKQVLTYSTTREWLGSWTTVAHTGSLPELPQEPGSYTLEIYYDGFFFAAADFTVQ